jgi:hypothetical protein
MTPAVEKKGAADWHAACTLSSAPLLGKKRWGKRFLIWFLLSCAVRDPRGPLIGSLIFFQLRDHDNRPGRSKHLRKPLSNC